MRLHLDRLTELVEHLYTAALQPEHWNVVLANLNETFSSNVATIFGQAWESKDLTFIQAAGPLDGQFQEFAAHYVHKDPRISRSADHPVNSPVTERTLMSRKEWRSSEMFNDFARRFDVPYLLGATLIRDGHERVICSLNRSWRVFSASEMEFAGHLFPHVTRAVRISQRLVQYRVSIGSTLESLNRLPFGFIVVDRQGRILEATDRARSFFNANDGLCLNDGVISATLDAQTQELQTAIRLACAPLSSRLGHQPASIRITRRQSTSPLIVYVVPAGTPERLLEAGRKSAALVFVFDAASRQSDLPVILHRYGLSSIETRIVQALVSGARLADVAESLNLSVHSVRNAIKRVFSKTNTASQSDLVRLALHAQNRSLFEQD